MKTFLHLLIPVGILLLMGCNSSQKQTQTEPPAEISWRHFSTETADLAPPNEGNQQTASLVADLDKDGTNDFVITERTAAPSVVWYRKNGDTWERQAIDTTALRIEAGSTYTDIDQDGDIDIVFGGDAGSNQIWWWENPFPDYSPDIPWKRRLIKNGGANKHHDQMFADVDGDGREELIFWNQQGLKLMLAEIPENPLEAETWELHTIYTWSNETEPPQRGRYPGWKSVNEHEGLARIDMNGDGKIDIVGAGRWFEHTKEYDFTVHTIDEGYAFTRSLAAQFIHGGRPEVILVAGDGVAPMMFYEFQDGQWVGKTLIDSIYDGHSVTLLDFNKDGNWDVFNAEMGLGKSPNPKARVMLGDGKGNFEEKILLEGYGLHESLLVDLDGNGSPDILGKPYTWKAPRLDIWLNEN